MVSAAPQAVPSRFDWNRAPFLGGRNGARMALRPVPVEQWLTKDLTEFELRTKVQRLSAHWAQVYARWQDPDALSRCGHAEAQLWQLAEQEMPLTPTLPGTPSGLDCTSLEPTAAAFNDPSPLVALALQVPEDLCLLWHYRGDYRLLSACLCQPSYWRLADKIGETLDGIHAPVTDLNPQMAERMRQFFAQLPAMQVFERRNWSIHADGGGFLPVRDPRDYATVTGNLFLRSERQTLRRIDSDLIAFGIRVDLEPLTNIANHPAARVDLQRAVQTLAGTALADFGGVAKQRTVLARLAAMDPGAMV